MRVESLEFRVEIRCVRFADTVLIGTVIFYCPVGRGDPTPPENLAVAAKLPGTVKTVPYKPAIRGNQTGKKPFPQIFSAEP